ncbi:type II secretion system protein [Verrucomicrobiaceae bacterium 5K15]|nr:type II secretion system protein [Oceaniferula flavus]
MKLTKTANTKLKPGMTLIEITVVILVLLTLISVLFIGANIYKKGADRAACILNIRNVHQAVRANQNLKGINTGTTLTMSDEIYSVSGTERYLSEPTCPTAGGAYTPETTYPEVGTAAVRCAEFGAVTEEEQTAIDAGSQDARDLTDHVPENTNGW